MGTEWRSHKLPFIYSQVIPADTKTHMLRALEEMAAFSVNGAGETGRPRTEGLNLTPHFSSSTKINSKSIKDLNSEATERKPFSTSSGV